MAKFDINVYMIAREKFYPCKLGRGPDGALLISYNADRAPYNVVRWPEPVRYVTTQDKILKSQIAEIVRCQFYL